jgi:hypothetical protein
MKKEYIEIFKHLSSENYDAASDLAHILSSGSQFWEMLMREDMSRDEMLTRLES